MRRAATTAIVMALCGGCFNPTARDSDPGTTTAQTTTAPGSTGDAPTTTCASECQPPTTSTSTTTPPGPTTSGTTADPGETGATTEVGPGFVQIASVPVDSPFALVAGRFDGLDNLDLMVTSEKNGITRISGGLWTPDPVLPDYPPGLALALANFPEIDALDDLIVAELSTFTTILSVSGMPPVPLWSGMTPCVSQALVFADLVGDANPDVVLLCPGATAVRAYIGVGQSLFEMYQDIDTMVPIEAFAVANFVGSPVPDLLIASAGAGESRVLPGVDKTTFAAPLEFPMETPTALAVDPSTDPNNPAFASAVVSQGTGCVQLAGGAEVEVSPPFDCGDSVLQLALGDIDLDGLRDLVTLGSTLSNPGLNVYTSDGAGNFTHEGTYEVGKDPHRLVLADLDSDGRLDIAVTTGNTVDIFRNGP